MGNTSAERADRTIGDREAHATRAFFFIGGFGAASWAPLVPLLRERLAIGDDVLGLLLLCIGIGSLLTMPLSGGALGTPRLSPRAGGHRHPVRRCTPLDLFGEFFLDRRACDSLFRRTDGVY